MVYFGCGIISVTKYSSGQSTSNVKSVFRSSTPRRTNLTAPLENVYVDFLTIHIILTFISYLQFS